MPRSWNPWSTSGFSQETENTVTVECLSTFTEARQASRKDQLAQEQDRQEIDFVAFLAIAQSLDITFLPIPWLPATTKLGTGGTAEVRQAYLNGVSNFAFKRLTLGRTHTFRVLHSELAVSGHPAIRHHENIAGLEAICWDVDADVGVVWPVLVFAKSPFGSLAQFMQSNAGQILDASQKLKLLKDVAGGLLCLHSYDAIHGDVTPVNVLVFGNSDSGYVTKVADFGYASFASDHESVFLAVQAPWSHHQYHGQPVTGQVARTLDMFCFGLLCGWLTFYDASDLNFQAPYNFIQGLNQKGIDPLQRLTNLLYDCAAFSLDLKNVLSKVLEMTLSGRIDTHPIDLCSVFTSTLDLQCASELHTASRISSNQLTHVLQPFYREHVWSQLPPLPLFKVSRSLFDLLNSDFRLLGYIRSQLKHQAANSTIAAVRANAQFQLAVICTLGLDGRQHDRTAETWLSMSGSNSADLDSEIDRVRSETDWKLGGKITTCLRADGVLDRLDQVMENRTILLDQEKLHYEGVIEGLSKIFEPSHGLIILCRYKLVSLQRECGHYVYAQRELLKLLDLMTDTPSWGPVHPSTLVIRGQATVVSFKLGDFTQAEELFMRTLEDQQTTFGPTLSRTTETLTEHLLDCEKERDSEEKTDAQSIFPIREDGLMDETLKNDPSIGDADITEVSSEDITSARRLFQISVDNFKRFHNLRGTDQPEMWSDYSGTSSPPASLTENEDTATQTMPNIAEDFKFEHRDMFHLIGDLAIKLRGQGDIDEAMEISKLLLSQRHLADINDPYRLTIQSNLVAMLMEEGHREEASEIEFDLLAQRRAILGNEHPECMSALFDIGVRYSWDGHNAEAKQVFEEVLQQQQKSLGAEDLHTLTTIEHLAGTYAELGDYERAKSLYEQNLHIFSKQGGALHPKALETVRNLACLNIAIGNYAEALSLSQRTLQGETEALRYSPLETMLSMDAVGTALKFLRRNEEAEQFYLQALEVAARHRHRVEVLILKRHYGQLLTELGRYAEAEKYYLEALEQATRYEYRLQSLRVKREYARLLTRLDRNLEAEKCYQEALKMGTELRSRLDILQIKGSYGLLLSSLGRYVEAEKYYLEALEVWLEPGIHQHILSLKHMYGMLLYDLARYTEAGNFYLEALKLESEPVWYGEYLFVKHSYGVLLYTLGRYTEARDQIQVALDGRRQLLGEDHRATLVSSSMMDMVLKIAGISVESSTALEDSNDSQYQHQDS